MLNRIENAFNCEIKSYFDVFNEVMYNFNNINHRILEEIETNNVKELTIEIFKKLNPTIECQTKIWKKNETNNETKSF